MFLRKVKQPFIDSFAALGNQIAGDGTYGTLRSLFHRIIIIGIIYTRFQSKRRFIIKFGIVQTVMFFQIGIRNFISGGFFIEARAVPFSVIDQTQPMVLGKGIIKSGSVIMNKGLLKSRDIDNQMMDLIAQPMIGF